MTLPIWEYKLCDCKVKIIKKGTIFSPREGYWSLQIDGEETGLQEGLKKLGQKGWELAGIQTLQTEDHRNPNQKNNPVSCYIFKRPI